MLYEDRIEVATPEGVTLEFHLAGIGSRMVAALLDLVVLLVVSLGLGLVAWAVSLVAGDDWAGVFFVFTMFAVLLGYHILFETLGGGRTPGQRWSGLRVVRVGGGPVTFLSSAVRNLLRLVDFLPFAYMLGMACVWLSSKNQRLGDMAAGTLVVRERTAVAGMTPVPRSRHTGEPLPWRVEEPWVDESSSGAASSEFVGWDVSAVTAEEVAMIRQFLGRRRSLEPAARRRLALELANRLRPKVVMPEERMGPEGFLVKVLAAKTERE